MASVSASAVKADGCIHEDGDPCQPKNAESNEDREVHFLAGVAFPRGSGFVFASRSISLSAAERFSFRTDLASLFNEESI
jgi:hypothetical protein